MEKQTIQKNLPCRMTDWMIHFGDPIGRSPLQMAHSSPGFLGSPLAPVIHWKPDQEDNTARVIKFRRCGVDIWVEVVSVHNDYPGPNDSTWFLLSGPPDPIMIKALLRYKVFIPPTVGERGVPIGWSSTPSSAFQQAVLSDTATIDHHMKDLGKIWIPDFTEYVLLRYKCRKDISNQTPDQSLLPTSADDDASSCTDCLMGGRPEGANPCYRKGCRHYGKMAEMLPPGFIGLE
jgi:hypothetical protein